MTYTFKTQICYLEWCVLKMESEFTAMGFFTVSKSSMITGFSTVLGYLIILIQFK